MMRIGFNEAVVTPLVATRAGATRSYPVWAMERAR